MGNRASSEELLVRYQFESQDSGMSRDGALWDNTVWDERPTDSGDVTLCDQSGTISEFRGKQERYVASGLDLKVNPVG